MVGAANNLLEMLTPEQRKVVLFDWRYVPRTRSGLALKDMTVDRRQMAMHFLKAGLSHSGYIKATNIMALETLLREIETSN